jgi:threonine/homoserine/homoserine lactone efflux protein
MTALTLCGGAYMLWLAWRLLRVQAAPAAATATAGQATLRPMTFWGACLFQLVNAKGWAAAVAAVGITARWPVPQGQALAWVLATTLVVNLPSLLLWNSGGALLRRLLDTPRVRRVFDFAMAALVLATALWMLQPLARSISLAP